LRSGISIATDIVWTLRCRPKGIVVPLIRRLVRDMHAATVLEYVLIASMLAVMAASTLSLLNIDVDTVGASFGKITSRL
jgi:Flp pilus assembly pilin Flp